jgi:hypothetical protein
MASSGFDESQVSVSSTVSPFGCTVSRPCSSQNGECSGATDARSFPRSFLRPPAVTTAASPAQALRGPEHPSHSKPHDSPAMRQFLFGVDVSSPIPDHVCSSTPEQLAEEDMKRALQSPMAGPRGFQAACSCTAGAWQTATVRAGPPSNSPRTVQRVLLSNSLDQDAVLRERQQLQQWLARNAANLKQLDDLCANNSWATGSGGKRPLPPPAFVLMKSYV